MESGRGHRPLSLHPSPGCHPRFCFAVPCADTREGRAHPARKERPHRGTAPPKGSVVHGPAKLLRWGTQGCLGGVYSALPTRGFNGTEKAAIGALRRLSSRTGTRRTGEEDDPTRPVGEQTASR